MLLLTLLLAFINKLTATTNSSTSAKRCNNYQECMNITMDCDSVSDCYVDCLGTKSCSYAKIYNTSQALCYGDSSCTNTVIKMTPNTNAIVDDTYYSKCFCLGYASCYNARQLTLYDELQCNGVLSCANIDTISFYSTQSVIMECAGTYSCIKSVFKSQSSTSGYTNSRLITMYCEGTFDFYGSTIYSNGNDYRLLLYGYYSGYGLTIYCTDQDDTCTLLCVGLSCLNTTCISSSVNANGCDKQCLYNDDLQCQQTKDLLLLNNITRNSINSNNSNNSNSTAVSFDYMAYFLNDLLGKYYNLSILPISNINDVLSKYVDYDILCQTASSYAYNNQSVEDNDDYVLNVHVVKNNNTNINICCLGYQSCLKYSKGLITTNGDIYCNGVNSCAYINNMTGSNIYCAGSYACLSANISFKHTLNCGGYSSCTQSTIANGKIVVCIGANSCSYTTISNVDIVMGFGWYSLLQSKIINASYVYLVGYWSGYGLTIQGTTTNIENKPNNTVSNSSSDNNHNLSLPIVYCQNYACVNINTTLYCKTYTFEQGNIISYIDNCSLTPFPPTMEPTMRPTMTPSIFPSNHNKSDSDSISKIVDFLSKGTIIFPIVLGLIGILLIAISVRMRNKKITQIDLNDDNNNNLLLVKDSMHMYSLDYGNVDYQSNRGFGKYTYFGHLAILFILFEIYDVYTDIAYLVQLFANDIDHYYPFYIFMSSLILTIVFNVFIVGYWLKYEFAKNIKFRNWYYEASGIITSLLLLFVLTDITLIINVFTSQIFGNEAFYSPISHSGITMLNISTIVSIVIEHLPQLFVQIYVLSTSDNHNSFDLTAIGFATLIVSGLDILKTGLRAFIWFILYKTKRKAHSNR